MNRPESKTDLSVVIPFLNEAQNLPALARKLDEFFASWRGVSAEVIFVDDGSTDDSVARLVAWQPLHFRAQVVRLSRNFGSHAAIRAGIASSSGEYVMNLGADLQDPVDLVRAMYEKARAGYDIVFGIRKTVRRGWSEGLFSRAYAKLMRLTAFPSFPENGTDIVLINRKVARELNAHMETDSSLFLQIMSLGFRQTGVSFHRQGRAAGASKWTFQKKVKLLVDTFVAFSYAPIRFSSLCGMTLSVVGLFWAAYVAARALILRDLNPGWPSLTAILMIGFGITNISLGIIGEYLWRTSNAARGRKPFVIDECVPLDAGNRIPFRKKAER